MNRNSKAPFSAQTQSVEENPCFRVVRMHTEGKLPDGFDFEEACADPHFAELCSQYEAEAAVVIYQLEKERDDALSSARTEVQQQVRKRNAMPVQRRANAPLSADVDCWQMTDEEFRAYDAAMKRQRQAARANSK